MQFTSSLIENAVNQIAKLPGIGKKTALRLALQLLKEDTAYTTELTQALQKLREEITYCKSCHSISDHDICGICADKSRDSSVLCIVETTQDIMAIENTSQYRGYYHVLGGVIDPLNGVGPDDLNLGNLESRVAELKPKEIIMALNPTMQGDTTAYYLQQQIKQTGIAFSAIARGVSIGSELEYTDEVTLGRSILSRTTLQ